MIDRELTKEEKGELTKQFMAAAIVGFCANPDFSDNTYDRIAEMAFEQKTNHGISYQFLFDR